MHAETDLSLPSPLRLRLLDSRAVLSFLNFIIVVVLAALGLCCCMQAFSSRSEKGYPPLWCVGFPLPWLLLLQSTG